MECPNCRMENSSDARFCAYCGTEMGSSDETRMPDVGAKTAADICLSPGVLVADKYRISGQLGRGGMGIVYRAEDLRLKRDVALKFLPSDLTSDRKVKRRFIGEARTASALDHPNICTIYEIDETPDGRIFIAMACYDGETVKKKISRGPMGVGEAMGVAAQVAEALEEAHEKGIVHRDIKPGNLMVTERGLVKVMDFGLAKLVDKGATYTRGFPAGTVSYMSPEQAGGEDIDYRTDLWALGVVLYEMLTGRQPHTGDNPLAIIYSILNKQPVRPSQLRPDMPRNLDLIILKLLERDRNKRYRNAIEVLVDLSRVARSLGDFEPTWRRVTSGPRQSVAVLPFLDLSADGDQEYFCEGIAEEIINALAKVENLRVVARSSSFRFKDKDREISQIAADLGVSSVLDGSVRKAGDRLRIGTRLIDASDGFHIWSETYDRDAGDLFAVQDEIALAVVDALRVNLLGKEKAEVTKRHTVNLDAYYLYLQGLWFINRRTREDVKKAICHFERAVAKDSRYALAYSGLADSYSMLPQYSTARPKDVLPKAKDAAARALELDDKLAEAHASLGLIKVFYDWDWSGAEKQYMRAIELGPRNASAHHWYGFFLMSRGRFDEAKEQMEIARELDPLSLVINRNIGQVLYYAGDYEGAMAVLMRTLDLDPDYSFASFCLGKVYLRRAMYAKALVEFERHRAMASGWAPEGDAYLGITHALMGDRKQAAQVLENMERHAEHEFAGPSPLAWLSLALGQEEKAIDLLEEAVAERDHEIVMLGVDPIYDKIRSHPRFIALLNKMGLAS